MNKMVTYDLKQLSVTILELCISFDSDRTP